jgi:hypothetical protein
VIYPKYTSRVVSLLALLPMLLAAHRPQENAVPLKNWASPLYWQPNPAESQARGTLLPRGATPAPEPSFLTFVAITPCRLVDTRGAAAGFFGGVYPFNGPSLGPGTTTTFPVQSSAEFSGPDANTGPAACGVIPSIAEAYSFNVTLIPQAGAVDNFVTLWPAESAQPVVSTLNDTQGLIIANAAIIAAGEKGAVSLYNSGPASVDVVIDMNGYFAAPTDLNGNTALGAGTLTGDTSGYGNVAIGEFALTSNTSGGYNVANGVYALASNTTGGNNTASGQSALANNTQGSFNTAYGNGALQYNSLGTNNTALGNLALQNTTASYNTVTGDSVMIANTTGAGNTAFGASALSTNQTGGDNIALGGGAGSSAPPANNFSIYIGSSGGNTDPSGVIQIGTQNEQTGGTSIAGIYGGFPNPTTRKAVCVDANGILGTFGCGGQAGAVAAVSPHADEPVQNQLRNQSEEIRKQAEQSRKLEDRLRAVETLLAGAPATQ